jgi:hypothetical protein
VIAASRTTSLLYQAAVSYCIKHYSAAHDA